MMEMMTNYTYTIDVISDADGEEETWGTEAGFGIISADQILGWIAANCRESCPGKPGQGLKAYAKYRYVGTSLLIRRVTATLYQ